jgi:hypothetical protein
MHNPNPATCEPALNLGKSISSLQQLGTEPEPTEVVAAACSAGQWLAAMVRAGCPQSAGTLGAQKSKKP